MALAALATLSLTSCVKETLCEEEVMPHQAKVNFNYDWTNLVQRDLETPDSMFIVVDRVIGQMFGSIGFDTETNTGRIISPFTAIVPEENTGITDFDIYSGEYKFLTVSLSSKNFDYAALENAMKSSLSSHLSSVTISYKSYQKGSGALEEPGDGWVDANQYTRIDGSPSGFVLSESAPVVIDSTVIYKWEPNETKTINFKPTTITHDIDVFFDIKKDIHDVSFEIDSVYAVISGIPHKVNLGTGGLDISNTDKMIFKTDFVSPNVVPDFKSPKISDSPSNTTVRCYKNVTVLGIVENELAESDLYAGPGVMQLFIYCKVYDPEDPFHVIKKKVTGMVNIHKSLQNAKLQMYDPDLQLYHKTREHSDLYIGVDVTINKGQLIGTEDGGIIKWNEKEIPGEFDIY